MYYNPFLICKLFQEFRFFLVRFRKILQLYKDLSSIERAFLRANDMPLTYYLYFLYGLIIFDVY